jgi:hypothetical protein
VGGAGVQAVDGTADGDDEGTADGDDEVTTDGDAVGDADVPGEADGDADGLALGEGDGVMTGASRPAWPKSRAPTKITPKTATIRATQTRDTASST